MGRWIRFLLAICLGLVLGVIYGWMVNPVQYVDTTPDSLREDYKTDYVLMVAEAYQGEGNLALSVRQLAVLGDDRPIEMVQAAVLFASKVGYAPEDLAIMVGLEKALQSWNPSLAVPTP